VLNRKSRHTAACTARDASFPSLPRGRHRDRRIGISGAADLREIGFETGGVLLRELHFLGLERRRDLPRESWLSEEPAKRY